MDKLFNTFNKYPAKFKQLSYDFGKKELTFSHNDKQVKLATHKSEVITFYLDGNASGDFHSVQDAIDYFFI